MKIIHVTHLGICWSINQSNKQKNKKTLITEERQRQANTLAYSCIFASCNEKMMQNKGKKKPNCWTCYGQYDKKEITAPFSQ